MKNINLLALSILFFATLNLKAKTENDSLPIINEHSFNIHINKIIVQNIKTKINISVSDDELLKHFADRQIPVMINGIEFPVDFTMGEATIDYSFDKEQDLVLTIDNYTYQQHVDPIPIWFSIIPPLIAILFALIFKEVFTALFIGILVGTSTIFFHQGYGFFSSFFRGLFAIVDTYILDSLTDGAHMSIIIFSMLIGAMVNIITRNGGMKGIVNILSRYANSPRSGQFVTWLLGIAIFFDDYANTLVVGNTMRPVTDRLKISRQKLAYIVDSTAAPIAAIAFVTTWIGAELSYIQDGIATIGIDESPYSVFISSLAYSFYPILALIFIPILIFTKRDFGSMYHAEKKARIEGANGPDDASFSNKLNELEISDHIKPKWFNAAIPVLIVVFGTFIGLLYTGWDQEVWNSAMPFSKKLSSVIGNSDSYQALLWSSLAGVLIAITLSISQKILSLKETIDSLINGFRMMLTAIIILTLAWSIALITKHLHTADFISQSLLSINIAPYYIPAFTFILAALVAFSTGSSWGTMAILYPLILPASWLIANKYGLDYNGSLIIFHNVVSTVLAGSVLGDHCSPISDTTILSSLASSCNHIEHVRTQLPYALVVGVISIVFGTIPAAFGVTSLILFPISIILLILVVRFVGKKTC